MRRVLVIGGSDGTNVAASLKRAGDDLGVAITLVDHAEAMQGPGILRRIAWHAGGRRPLRLKRFSQKVLALLEETSATILIGTGAAYIARWALEKARSRGVVCINFSTDDPWNPAHSAAWLHDALPAYDIVFTPRRSNISDFERIGCNCVRYLPFGYDDQLFQRRETGASDAGGDAAILFVGGADEERASFIGRLRRSGLRVVLVGSYWERYAETRNLSLGQLKPERLSELTSHAAVNLCLVRRANRDGHVMRSFEIPAVGGFMIAEDTAEHRELFGEEGKAVLYFGSPEQAADKCRWALANAPERHRMTDAAHVIVTSGGHTYRDRLRTMIEAAAA